MFIFSNNKYFAILLGRLELHALSPLRGSISPWYTTVLYLHYQGATPCTCLMTIMTVVGVTGIASQLATSTAKS